MIARPMETASPKEVRLAEREQLAKELAAAEAMGNPVAAAALRGSFAQYSHELGVVGLTDAQLAANYQGGRLGLLLVWSVAKVMVGAPFAMVGAVVHAIPYQVIKRVAKIPSSEGMKATVKLLGCFAAFSLLYAGLAVAAAESIGPVPGLAVGLGSPLCGYVAVRFSERVKSLGGSVAGYRTARHASLSTVRQHRLAVVTSGRALRLKTSPSKSPSSGS